MAQKMVAVFGMSRGIPYHNRNSNSNRENINLSDEIIKFISIAVTVKAKHKTLKNEMCKWLMQWLIMK
jgi:hypothetical protein